MHIRKREKYTHPIIKNTKNTSFFLHEKINASLLSLMTGILVSVSASISSSIFTSMPKFHVADDWRGYDDGSDLSIHGQNYWLLWSMENPGNWNQIHNIHLQLEQNWQVTRTWGEVVQRQQAPQGGRRILVGAGRGSDDDLCALA